MKRPLHRGHADEEPLDGGWTGALPTLGDWAGIQNLPDVLQAADDNRVIAVSASSQVSD
jgi:hypothetical protein